MTSFIIILLLLSVVVAIMLSKRRKNAVRSTPITMEPSSSAIVRNQSKETFDSTVNDVERIALQVLETTHIIATSKSLDTVQSRFQFLIEILPALIKSSSNPRFELLVQRALDQYKSTYYSTIPQDFQMAAVLRPDSFDLAEFYCNSLGMAMNRYLEEQAEAIRILKSAGAINRRLEKVGEVLRLTKSELALYCSTSPSYSNVCMALDKVEVSLQRGEAGSGQKIPSKIATPAKEVSTAISIRRKSRTEPSSEFVFNSDSPLRLTLINADVEIAERIRAILEDDSLWDGHKRDQIAPLFAEFNLRVKEIEEYRTKYSSVYLEKLEELKATSNEWPNANALDREELMADFRPIALRSLYERASCDLVTLFECEPEDFTADDALIKEYGFELFETYLRFADNIDKVRVIPSDHYSRDSFVRLVEVGLAVRGSSIPLLEILGSLTLKVLNEIAANPEKEFKRKNQAIEYITSKVGYEDRIISKVGLLELFKLQPLPEKYSSIDVRAIAKSWKYTYTVVELFIHSYNSVNEAKTRVVYSEYSDNYSIYNRTDEVDRCPRAGEFAGVLFSIDQPSPVPCHIGCNCSVRPA